METSIASVEASREVVEASIGVVEAPMDVVEASMYFRRTADCFDGGLRRNCERPRSTRQWDRSTIVSPTQPVTLLPTLTSTRSQTRANIGHKRSCAAFAWSKQFRSVNRDLPFCWQGGEHSGNSTRHHRKKYRWKCYFFQGYFRDFYGSLRHFKVSPLLPYRIMLPWKLQQFRGSIKCSHGRSCSFCRSFPGSFRIVQKISQCFNGSYHSFNRRFHRVHERFHNFQGSFRSFHGSCQCFDRIIYYSNRSFHS